MLIHLENITSNPWQTRQANNPEYVKSLAEDIYANGLLQTPLGRLVDEQGKPIFGDHQEIISSSGSKFYFRDHPDQSVQLAFGHNRLAAYRLLAEQDASKGEKVGYDLMPVDVRNLTDEQMADYAWSENEKRREHTPVERARAIRQRMEYFEWTQAQVAAHLGISRPAVSNALRLLKLPEEILEKLLEGEVSERVAMALVSLFDLPDQLRTQAERPWHDESSPSTIVRKALDGELTSDSIRKSISEICQRFGNDLSQAPFKPSDVFDLPGIESSSCRDCNDYRLKERNICIVRSCFEAKTRAAIGNYLLQASQVCGIPPLEDGKGDYDVTNFRWSNRERFPVIKSSGCENLRLMYSPKQKIEDDKDRDQRIEGFPHALIVCGRREQYCNCLKGLKATSDIVMSSYNRDTEEFDRSVEPSNVQLSSAQPTAEELKELAKAARKEKREANQEAKGIVQEVAERIATGLAMKNKDTWKVLACKLYFNPTGDTVWDLQVAIGKHIAEKDLPYEINHIEEVIYKMNVLLKECGLQPLEAVPEDRVLEQQARAAAEAEEPEFQGKPLVEVLQEQPA